jgi:hypothetical protein
MRPRIFKKSDAQTHSEQIVSRIRTQFPKLSYRDAWAMTNEFRTFKTISI